MDYIIAIKELCRYRLFACLLKLAWGQICSMACGTWQFGLAFRFFNCGIDENLYFASSNGRSMWFCVSQMHDLFACDGNQFGLFGSKVSLEVPVAAQFGLRAVAYPHTSTEDSKKRQRSQEDDPNREERPKKILVYRNLAPGVARGYAPGHKKICIFPQATP
ncbi:hypothetical protein T09_11014 [Trichinella sp. T9]|nr:hypothetical protein T09_11014 [Trichinella sp. T9]